MIFNKKQWELEQYDSFYWEGTKLTIDTDVYSWQEFINRFIDNWSEIKITTDYETKWARELIFDWVFESFTIVSSFLKDDDTIYIELNTK